MLTLTRFVAAAVTAAGVPACSVIASSVAHADLVATTATVLKVVDGDTLTSSTTVEGGYASACWATR
jgi:micrococcal nuclease